MSIKMELDDGSELDASDLRAALTTQTTAKGRTVVYVVHPNGAELAVGFSGLRAVGLWQPSGDDPAVTTGGTNTAVVTYGWSQIPVPVGAEIDAAAVLDAAEEFAAIGTRPTGVRWQPYVASAFPADDSTITAEGLRALLDEPDAGR